MPRIQQLNQHVINKIAAGEVIERPASVVKELLENSVDALATRIEVDVAEGGSELIRVVDDGEGIHPDDLLLAVTSHATSKLRQADDLFRVKTLGFRGEALASISEVSQFRLRSRTAETPEGMEVHVEAGEFAEPRPCGCPIGTQIEVRQLFINTPVRRKFLKSASTELGHITEQFTRIALANPRLHLVLRHNQKLVYELPATDRLSDRLRLFYGGELADQLITVEAELNGTRMWGCVAHPSQNKATRKGQYLFLNGRWIQDRSLQHALGEAYRGLLMVGRYPIAFLFLEMPAELVDVNVHPTKSEVRFQDGQQLYRLMLSTLRTRFLGMNLEGDIKVGRGGTPVEKPRPVTADPQRQLELQQELADWARVQASQWSTSQWSPPSDDAPFESEFATAAPVPATPAGTFEESDGLQNFLREPAPFAPFPSLPSRNPPFAEAGTEPALPAGFSPSTLPAELRAPVLPGGLPLRAMQIHNAYLVAETDEGLTVIDQHALHERVLYEQFRGRILAGAVESQRLLMPETLELGMAETNALLEHRELLARLGLGIEDFGGQTLLVNSYPAMLSRGDLGQLVRDIAEQLLGAGQAPTRRDLLDELLHMMSCKAAIKAGDRLTPEEIDSLLAQRHLIDDAHHCPHGRPSALVLSRAELDRQFGRMG